VVTADIKPGQTPPDPDELAGLIPEHITTQGQLNEWEQANILRGQAWGLRQVKKGVRLLDEGFVRELHRRMFDKTWHWAGTFRHTDKSIGIPWEHVAQRLHQLLGNYDAQIEFHAFPADELAIRFHRDLVWIHPFPNGNGRHARLMADLLILRLGGERFKWGAKANLASAGAARDEYIAALKEADKGNFAPLIQFARS
jgi:Fic-DOC domain mobile mystery protein B